MRFVTFALVTLIVSINSMQNPTQAVLRDSQLSQSYSMRVPELSGAARARGYKRKSSDLPVSVAHANEAERTLVNYLNQHLAAQYVQPLLTIIFRLERSIYDETYFDDYYWFTNDGRDLLKLSKELIQLINSNRRYFQLAKSSEFMTHLINYITKERYPETTNQVRAVIPFAQLPAAVLTLQKLYQLPDFEKKWCKELTILERWLDTAQQPTINDPFFQDGILLLINGLPDNHPLFSRDDSCLKDLLFHATIGNYDRIFNVLLKKGVDINWKNNRDETPLSKAAFYAHETMVRKMLKAGADVNIPSIFSQTPLDFANLSPSPNKNTVIKLLIDNGAKTGEQL